MNIGFLFGFENLIVTYIILYFMAYFARKILGHRHDGGRFSEELLSDDPRPGGWSYENSTKEQSAKTHETVQASHQISG